MPSNLILVEVCKTSYCQICNTVAILAQVQKTAARASTLVLVDFVSDIVVVGDHARCDPDILLARGATHATALGPADASACERVGGADTVAANGDPFDPL